MLAVEIVFWLCVALLVHTHVTYPLSLAVLARLRAGRRAGSAPRIRAAASSR